MSRIFIGVAWPYSNNAQHFGHLAGVYLPADIFARYHRSKGNEVLMVSGSDMHGTPTAVAAEKQGIAPEIIAEKFHKINSESLKKFGISYDIFTKTSTIIHTEVVHDLFLTLLNKGYIYNAEMNSSFCPNCKRFLPDRFVEGMCPHCKSGDARGDQCNSCGKLLDPEELINPKCKICGSPSEIRASEHFFLKLMAFQEDLKKYLEDKKFWKANVINFTNNILAQGLKDRAVTRDIEYGVTIPIDGFEKKRIYVWFEAVSGYLSASKAWAEALGHPDYWEKFWKDPCCKHYYFLGKDNIMFHTIIWPAILLGYGDLNMPYNVPANDHLTMAGEKLSKSKTKDTSIWLPDYLDNYKPDPMRYYLTIHMPELHDTAFTWEEFFEKNNSELVGAYGNFIHRVLTFTFANFGQIPDFDKTKATESDSLVLDQIKDTKDKMGHYIENCQFKNALENLMQLAHFGNRYFNDQAPWNLIKIDKVRCSTVLNTSLKIVSALAVLSAPFMPESSEKLWKMLGNEKSILEQSWDNAGEAIKPGTKLSKPEVLFIKLGEETTFINNAGVIRMNDVEKELDKIDMRIAKVVTVEDHPNADRLYKLTIDLGNGNIKTSVAGLKKYYTPDQLQGKKLVVITNLEPAVLRGIQSEVMLLAAEDSKTVSVLIPASDVDLDKKVCPGKIESKAQLKFADFQKMDIRTGIVKEPQATGLLVEAGQNYNATRVTDSSIIGRKIVIIASPDKNAAILETENGVSIITDRDVETGSKIK